MVPFHTCVDCFVNMIIQFFEDTAIHVAKLIVKNNNILLMYNVHALFVLSNE